MSFLEGLSAYSLYLTAFIGVATLGVAIIYFAKKKVEKGTQSTPFSSEGDSQESSLIREVVKEPPERFPWEKQPKEENPKTLEQVMLEKIKDDSYEVEWEEADGRSKGSIKLWGAPVKLKSLKRRKTEETEETEEDLGGEV